MHAEPVVGIGHFENVRATGMRDLNAVRETVGVVGAGFAELSERGFDHLRVVRRPLARPSAKRAVTARRGLCRAVDVDHGLQCQPGEDVVAVDDRLRNRPHDEELVRPLVEHPAVPLQREPQLVGIGRQSRATEAMPVIVHPARSCRAPTRSDCLAMRRWSRIDA